MATKRRAGPTVLRRLGGHGQQVLEVHRLGPHPVIQHFLERLGVARILDNHIYSSRDGTLSHGRTLAVLVHNVLVARDPLYRLSEWLEPIDPQALGLSGREKRAINDDRVGRALEQLAEFGGRGVFFQLALRSIKLFKLETNRIHFDTTTVKLSGEYRGSVREPRITHGKSKDHRPDLKQLVFGVNVTADGAVPVSHGVYSGNRNDDTIHCSNVNALRDLLARDDFIYVADCKLCTKKNLAHIAAFEGKFVTVLPRSRKEDSVFREALRKKAARWHSILTVERADQAHTVDTYATTGGPRKTSDGFRLIWIRSSAKAEEDSRSRLKRINQAEDALKDLTGRLNKRQLKTPQEVRLAVKKILREYQCEEYLRVVVKFKIVTTTRRLRPGRPKPGDPFEWVSATVCDIKVTRDALRLRREANTDGVFPLVTNLGDDKKPLDVLQIYRYQPYLERRFENLKTEYAVAPVYLKKPERVVGLLHVFFLALMVGALIEREIRHAMARQGIHALPIYPEERECRAPTTPRVLDLFSQVTWYKHHDPQGSANFPARLSDLQAEVLRLLGMTRRAYEGFPFTD
jgi:transposase